MAKRQSDQERRCRALERLRERLPGRRRDWLERRTRPLPTHCVVALSNMHPLRADFILIRLAEGDSYRRANEASKGTYDTCYWGEFVSRLARARGSVLGSVARLARERVVGNGAPEDLAEVIATARQLRSTATRFLDSLRKESIESSDSRVRPRKNDVASPAKPAISRGELLRAIRQADALVAKNVRDLPYVAETTGAPLTLCDRSVMALEASRIAEGATLLETVATGSEIAGRRMRSVSSDVRGIGARYADSVDSYLLQQPNAVRIHAPATADLRSLFALWVREREFARSSVVVIDFGATATEEVDANNVVQNPRACGKSSSVTGRISSSLLPIDSAAVKFASSADSSVHDRRVRRLASVVEASYGKRPSRAAASLREEFEGLRHVAESMAVLYRGLAAVFDSECR